MKRHPCLVPLSDDHHRSLVLARRLKTPADSEDRRSLERETRQIFVAELEPHFRVEERWLVPPLERAGGGLLARQLLDEHARIRELLAGTWTRESAVALGRLLERHVRFEERVLFPEAERLLADDELAAVREATLAAARR
jgi:hypothetical protein